MRILGKEAAYSSAVHTIVDASKLFYCYIDHALNTVFRGYVDLQGEGVVVRILAY